MSETELSIEQKTENAIATAKGIVPSRSAPEDLQKVAQSILNLAHVKAANDSLGDTKELEEELSFVLGRVRPSVDATSLVQITQAAVHLVNARAILLGKTKPKKQGASAYD